MQVRSYLHGLSPSLFASDSLTLGRIEKLGMGESNINYLVHINGKPYVLRVQLTNRSHKEEFGVLKTLSKLGITPRPVFYDDSHKTSSQSVMLLEYVEGKTLTPDKALSAPQLRILAATLAKLHASRFTRLRKNRLSYAQYLQRINRELRFASKKFHHHQLDLAPLRQLRTAAVTLRKRTAGMKNPTCVTHGDIAPQNIIFTGTSMRFLDWEAAGSGDPAAEIAYVLSGVSFPITAAQQEIFVNEYLSIRKDPTMRKRIALFMPLIRLEQVLWCLRRIYEIIDKELAPVYLQHADLPGLLSFYEACVKQLANTGLVSRSALAREQVFPRLFMQ